MKSNKVCIIGIFVALFFGVCFFSTAFLYMWKKQDIIDNMQLNNPLNKPYYIDMGEFTNYPTNVPYIVHKYNADTFNLGDTVKGSFALSNNDYVNKISIIPKYLFNLYDTLKPTGDSLYVEFFHKIDEKLTEENPFDSTLCNYALGLKIYFPHPVYGDISVEASTNVYVRKPKFLKDKTKNPTFEESGKSK